MFKMPGSLTGNEKGGGLLLAGIAMLALAGAGYMMGSMFVNAQKVVKQDSRIASYQQLVDTVRKNLYAGSNCTQVLTNAKAVTRNALGQVSSTNAPLNLTAALNYDATKKVFQNGVEITLPIKLDDDIATLQPGWDAKTGTSIKSIRLYVTNLAKYPPPNSGTVRMVRYPTDPLSSSSALENLRAAETYLVIEPDHKGINVWQPENQKYWIKLYTYFRDADQTIHSCFDPTSEAAFCTEVMHGAYVNDPSVPAEQRCQPDVGCFTYKHGLVSAGEICPSIYEETYVGGASTNPSGGVTAPPQKICSWCPRQPLAILGLNTNFNLLSTDYVTVEVCDDDGNCETISNTDVATDVNCNASNPWSFVEDDPDTGESAEQIAWETYLEYKAEIPNMSAEDQAKYAGCINNPPPCWDNPNTCDNECTSNVTETCVVMDDGCFVPGTHITLADGSEKAIEDIKVGDQVISSEKKIEAVESLLKYPFNGSIFGINGGRPFFTPNHPFLTLQGWKSLDPETSMKEIPGLHVRLLEVGDVLVRQDGIEQVYLLNSSPYEGYVYNFSVSGSHSYMAENYAVHNLPADKTCEGCAIP